jgi:predicted nucleic acid-binding Zn ribbon protein
VKRAADVLRELLKQRGWEAADPYLPLFRCWPQIAGPQLGARSRLAEVEGGVLVVEVDHPGWLQMLQLRKSAILAAARAAAPGARIDELRGRIPNRPEGGAGGVGRGEPAGGSHPR